jgi:hypothetical protein
MVDNNCYITIGGHVHGNKFVVYPWAFLVPQSNAIYIFYSIQSNSQLKIGQIKNMHFDAQT